ncbi:hypothetical protein JB92DRAFT_3099263 [Gautieria morchelliformis]|nr:hypothetical protein JB92DRAFT_3099263 [Gautieria morchelliformis]
MYPDYEYLGVMRCNSNVATSSCNRINVPSLPEDIILQICFWLSVSDILSLRSANKAIYGFTQNSSVWLSLLRRLTIALPPAQPVFPGSLGYNSRLTLEFFVSRALKLEQNWRDYNPLPSHYRFNGHHRVLSMRCLPGGKHMVTVSQDPETNQESVVVWDMSFRDRRNHIAIAMLNSETPVQKLHARYASTDDHISLFVAFTRPPEEGRTVITAAFVPVETLHTLSSLSPGSSDFLEYSRVDPNPFTRVLDTRTRYPVGALSLSDINGCPLLAVVHRPRTVVFFDLRSGTRALIKLAAVSGYPQWRHSIWDIKILSSQEQVLVIRVLIGEVDMMDTNPLVFEIYDIPTGETEVENAIPLERKLILEHSVDGFFVSDGDASWNYRIHSSPDVPMLHKLSKCPPPPISIFVTTKAPRGFIHFVMLPEVINDGLTSSSTDVTEYIYRLPLGPRAQYEWDEEEQAVILPGAYHSVVWMRSPRRQPPEGRAIIRLAVYRTEGYTFSDSMDTGHTSLSATGSEREYNHNSDDDTMGVDLGHGANGQLGEHPRKRAMKYPVVPVEVARAMRNGTRCLQFDEWLGRLCIATTEDNFIQVLDWSV